MKIANCYGADDETYLRREVIFELSWEDYRAYPGLNSSSIKAGWKGTRGSKRLSVKAIRHAFENESEDTDDFLFGRALHCMILEPREFEERFVAYDGTRNRRHKAYQKFLDDHPGFEVMRQRDFDRVIEAGSEFAGNPGLVPLMGQSKTEVTALFPFCGLQGKARLDWLKLGDERFLLDVKTTVDASDETFGKQFFGLSYDLQLGYYQLGFKLATGEQLPVKVIAVEKKPPWEAVTYDVPQAVLDRGLSRAVEAAEAVAKAIEDDFWPGMFGHGSLPLFVPPWEMDEDDFEVAWSEDLVS